jgi:hypothetical protein
VPDDLFNLRPHRFEGDAERLERLGGDALTLVDQPQQDVLGADVVVVEQPRLFLRQHHHSSGSVGESLEHPVGFSLSGGHTPLRRGASKTLSLPSGVL